MSCGLTEFSLACVQARDLKRADGGAFGRGKGANWIQRKDLVLFIEKCFTNLRCKVGMNPDGSEVWEPCIKTINSLGWCMEEYRRAHRAEHLSVRNDQIALVEAGSVGPSGVGNSFGSKLWRPIALAVQLAIEEGTLSITVSRASNLNFKFVTLIFICTMPRRTPLCACASQ